MNRTPLILAIVLLLLPVLYVGSYLVLVQPVGRIVWFDAGSRVHGKMVYYRWGDEWPRRVFWPLEKIDRKVRPGTWDRQGPMVGLEKQGGGLKLLRNPR